MNQKLMTRTLQLVLNLFGLACLLIGGTPVGASPANAATPAGINQAIGTDWDGDMPPPLDPLDSSIPPMTSGATSPQPFVVATERERPVIAAQASAPNAPAITLWYGTEQTFGQNGHPQPQINLLGNVTGTMPITLTYALNDGAAQGLNLGPDDRRLAEPGDFNIEITRTNLISGPNQVVITATDALSTTVLTATVNYVTGQVWPQEYMIDWSTVSDIQDVAQVVDGLWAIDDTGLRPLQFDYDRLIAIGDANWTDYEVTVPIFVRGIDEGGFSPPSNGAGIGLIAHWQGHVPVPEDTQPATGWRTQLGALAWYRWGRQNAKTIELRGTGGGEIVTNSGPTLPFNTPYYMKMSVQSAGLPLPYFRFKLWPADQAEPATWDVEGSGKAGNLSKGSLLLVAHHVDASFGTVVVKPLANMKPSLTVGKNGGGTVTVEPQLPQYDYGQLVRVTSINANGHYFDHWSGDLTSTRNPLDFTITQNVAITANFTTTPTNPISSTIASDDFNDCALDPRWEFINPLGDGTLNITGTQVHLTVPEGTSHNVYDNGIPAPRIMQAVADTDFEIEVKFESSVNRRFQVQGIIIEQDVEPDAEDFLRFDFFHDGTNVRIYAAAIQNGIPSPQFDAVMTGAEIDYYLRVIRKGSEWRGRFSFDGVNYTERNFVLTTPFTVNGVGVFAANHGNVNNPTSIPAHTAIVDYFFNAASPIEPEDGKPTTLETSVAPEGAGTVTITSPLEKTSFACGEQITVRATPVSGYRFAGWSGAIDGATNPATFAYNLGDTVTATFVKEEDVIYLPIIIGGE